MILDTIDNYRSYIHLHPLLGRVFEYLCATDFSKVAPGKIVFEGEPFYINVDENVLRREEDAYPEAHNEYIDIQMPIDGTERVGYIPRSECKTIKRENPEKDVVFYEEKPTQFFTLSPGKFVLFFPQDAHAPIIGEGKIKKIVAKIKIN